MGKDTLKRLEFNLLKQPGLVHGVYARSGGISEAPFSSLNVSYSSGDNPAHVFENRERVRRDLCLDTLLIPYMVHGAAVARITRENRHRIPEADALFTTDPGIGLSVTHADCQAGLFYDPVHRAVGIAHAGWRGSVQNIYARLIERMQQELGTRPADLLVAISPSLGPDHGEFIHYETELPKPFWAHQTHPNHFDFWAISHKQLTDCGVKHIEIARVCTVCARQEYFSYRGEKAKGRNPSVIALNEPAAATSC